MMTLETLVELVTARTMRGIALEVANLIRNGTIPIGSQLPPVRDLADAMGVSPATISGAWKQLRTYRMVSGSGRTGTWVRGDQTSLRPARYEDFANYGENIVADLRFASPDPQLLPDIREALSKAHRVSHLNSYVRDTIAPELEEVITQDWSYEGCTFTAVNGGYDGLHTTLQTIVVPGATVAIEDPTALRVFDILEKLGARVVGVTCDAEGPLPESLAAALNEKPAVFLFQPGSHALTGERLSAKRLKQLGALFKDNDTLIIELDGLAGLASQRPLSLGSMYPDRVVHIRTMSKSLGTDFRLAVLSSSGKFADQIQAYRNFREGWTSRILQGAAAHLLTTPKSLKEIEHARSVYAQRRETLGAAMTERGLPVSGRDALCIWLPVPDEQFALITLAARGIAVQPGSSFQVTPRPFIRVATSANITADNADAIADALAHASRRGEGMLSRE
ncbi:aminotransferase class I and II family protein [Paraburkholderia xenovorans LB400]|uniref:Transcriptional regulator, GntR family n=1 Tax=Paraburkholderia xenovorans (strain LB400) TaxID=266265 RepID=Q13WQ7_PARXL|nr:aminotransferase class I/II-fold pyridoxal phosphate-dependent enzyme [Paraburkholderia xenovorans]ABE31482.1 transcriptional regulator, GntR family [Paraburkholderia xenovorans LB400]AIP33247.1 aminotransferase class I and II family protein [Paraburkholderia xenovorans LB400]